MSAPLTEQAAALAIEGACRALHLPTVRMVSGSLAEAAVRDHLTHRAYLAEVLAAELDDRDGRRRERRIAEAHFPRLKRLADFDLSAAPRSTRPPSRAWSAVPGSRRPNRSCCWATAAPGSHTC